MFLALLRHVRHLQHQQHQALPRQDRVEFREHKLGMIITMYDEKDVQVGPVLLCTPFPRRSLTDKQHARLLELSTMAGTPGFIDHFFKTFPVGPDVTSADVDAHIEKQVAEAEASSAQWQQIAEI